SDRTISTAGGRKRDSRCLLRSRPLPSESLAEFLGLFGSAHVGLSAIAKNLTRTRKEKGRPRGKAASVTQERQDPVSGEDRALRTLRGLCSSLTDTLHPFDQAVRSI